jgi:hypothetical protein
VGGDDIKAYQNLASRRHTNDIENEINGAERRIKNYSLLSTKKELGKESRWQLLQPRQDQNMYNNIRREVTCAVRPINIQVTVARNPVTTTNR